MTWFRVCDTLHSHPKAHEAGLEAMGLWTLCGSWCGQQLSDGFVPSYVVRMYGSEELAARLVAAGLWITERSGWRFHDWADSNMTRAQVEAQREEWRQKKRRQRSYPQGPVDVSPRESPGVSWKGKDSFTTPSPFQDSRRDSRGESPGDRRTPTPPSIHVLCAHGRDGRSCPHCKREAV